MVLPWNVTLRTLGEENPPHACPLALETLSSLSHLKQPVGRP